LLRHSAVGEVAGYSGVLVVALEVVFPTSEVEESAVFFHAAANQRQGRHQVTHFTALPENHFQNEVSSA
jgi:hypothetical protein